MSATLTMAARAIGQQQWRFRVRKFTLPCIRLEPAEFPAQIRSLSSSTDANVSAGAAALPSSVPADFSDLLTEVSASRQPSAIRRLIPLLSIPGMISLGGGMPNPETFPFSKISVELKHQNNNNNNNNNNKGAAAGQEDQDQQPETLVLEGASLSAALQYSATSGLPALTDQLAELQFRFVLREVKWMDAWMDVWDGETLPCCACRRERYFYWTRVSQQTLLIYLVSYL